MENGMESKIADQTFHFKIAPLSQGEREATLKYIAIKDDGSIVWVKQLRCEGALKNTCNAA